MKKLELYSRDTSYLVGRTYVYERKNVIYQRTYTRTGEGNPHSRRSHKVLEKGRKGPLVTEE
jgi:hypothetical protein